MSESSALAVNSFPMPCDRAATDKRVGKRIRHLAVSFPRNMQSFADSDPPHFGALFITNLHFQAKAD